MVLSPRIKCLLAIIAVVIIFLLVSISLIILPFAEVSKDEVARLASPNGRIDAVLIETNGGATTSFGYLVYITKPGAKPKGSPIAILDGATRNQNAYGANLRWTSANQLSIEFLNAKKSDLISPNISIEGLNIVASLQPNVSDPLALPGGMEYNLKTHKAK